MGTLNPNLLTDELTDVLTEAVALAKRYRRRNIYPELVLLMLTEREDTAAFQILQALAERRGTDLEKLNRQARLAMEAKEDTNGDLDFLLPNGQKFAISRQMLIALDEGLTIAQSHGGRSINSDHLLAAFTNSRLAISPILQKAGITETVMMDIFADRSTETVVANITSRDLVAAARQGDLRAVYFRDQLLREIMNILAQSMRRHIILIGPDGVGKRTLAYSLALLITEGKGPSGLEKFVQIDEKALLDNSLEAIQSAMIRARGGILFVPHIHRFFGGAGKADYPKAGQHLQKAFLGNDPVVICTTSPAELEARVSKVNAVSEHSQILRVNEPTPEETLEILQVARPHIAAEYEIDMTPEALHTTVELAKRYITHMPLPRSAEHLLHRAAAMVSMSQQHQLAFKPVLENNVLDVEDVTLAAAQMTGIPVSKLDQDERSRYARMVEHLHERIIGQEDAVLAVSRAVKTARVGLKDPRRPIGSFLFLGPSGVGKTELAKALAEFMFDDENAILQIDMSEYMEENTVSRLIGAPPGYVGYEGGGQLTDRVREQPYIVVLFDEVEKAHQRILDILLQVLEEGRLTDAQGNLASFSEAVVILTSNIGSRYLSSEVLHDDTREQVMREVRSHFRPEFLNRLDDIVIFHPLSYDNLRDILHLMLAGEKKLGAQNGLLVDFSERSAEWLLKQNRTLEYGARPLRRILQRYVREPLADFLLRDSVPEEALVLVDADEDGLFFSVQ
jgi:ATP-dependent Clp protease ATP-binding subunit ClpC